MGPLGNDIQNQKVNPSAARHWDTERVQVEWGIVDWQKENRSVMKWRMQWHMLFVVRGQQTSLCRFKMICLKTRMDNPVSPQARYILSLCIETGRHCHSHLLSDRCCAGNPLWQAADCYKWADTLRDGAKAKNFTISSDARAADRKMRMTPPRSFSLSPCDAHRRCTSGACTTRCVTVTGSF